MVCRLCKSTTAFCNLFKMDGDFLEKILFCVNLKICPDDDLPPVICKVCKRKIKKFYTFKQNCLKVDFELRTTKELKESQAKIETDIQTNMELITELENSFADICPYEDIDSHIFHTAEDIFFKHNEDDTVQNSIQCEICGEILSSDTQYKTHLTLHREISTPNKLYQCKFCPKRFTRAESKEVHIRSHLGLRPFICEICGSSSTKRQDLMRHMKIHSDERNYECYTCSRRFKRSADLQSHYRIHTGARPYKCSMCDKTYTSHSGLRKHLKSHVS